MSKEIIVFFGTRQQANYWAREHGVSPREVILGTQPEHLRGLSGKVRTVWAAGWQSSSDAERRRIDQTFDYIEIIEATRPADHGDVTNAGTQLATDAE